MTSDRSELFDAISRDIDNRSTWETKQASLYKARYRGLRRTNIPWPGASDINWPLIDSIIEKLKPFYVQQLYSTELIASFMPTTGADGATAAMATTAAQWFDFQLKQETDLETQIIYVIDALLMLGRPAIKVTWDVDEKALCFTPIDPARIIVSNATTDLWKADRIVHVLSFTPEAYKRQPGFRTDSDFMRRITGKGDPNRQQGVGTNRPDQVQREGITYGNSDEIIVWEVWIHSGCDEWEVETFSPLCPEEDVKPKVGNVFAHKKPPFVDFPYELTQPNWHAPRGIGEILLPFQAELTKLLNEKNDAMTLANRPMFTSDRDVPNPLNLRWRPGQILPQGVSPAQFPPPPIPFENHMILMRDIAEKMAATPDYGMGSVQDVRKARTATEMDLLGSMNQQSSDLKMRVYRLSLGRLLKLSWWTLKQYAADRLQIWVDDVMVDVPKEALSKDYRIRPSGSADGVTRNQIWRKAVSRFQLFGADPFINRGELVKSVLEADDAGLVKRLYQDPGQKQATQTEDQVAEIAVMKLGFPAVVSTADDHATHVRTVLKYVANQHQSQQDPAPAELALLHQHMMAHVAELQKIDPKLAKEAMNAIQVIGEALSSVPMDQQEQQGQQVQEVPGA